MTESERSIILIKRIKALLLHIWPVSKMQFSHAHQRLSSTLDKLLSEQHKNANQEAEAKHIWEEIYTMIGALVQAMDNIEDKLKILQTMSADIQSKEKASLSTVNLLRKNILLVDCRLERTYYAEFPVSTSPESPDFQEDFLDLVRGMDQESIRTIVLEINRLKQIKACTNVNLDLFSTEEKEHRRAVFEELSSQILPLSESCYYWKGLMLPINHFEACVFYDKCGFTYLQHPERLRELDIIDAGAFIGDSALIFSQVTMGKVHAFEPTPANYELMMKTIEMNSLHNVVPCPYALGSEKGIVTISLHGSSSTQFENSALEYYGTYDVPVITLDDYVREHDLHIGLIKADIEGAEQLLLRGAIETIKTQKPALLISIYHNADDFFHIKPMLEELDLGYKFKVRHFISRGGSVMTETVLIAEVE